MGCCGKLYLCCRKFKNMAKKNTPSINDETQVFSGISHIIEKRKFNAVSAANSQVIAMFWEIGKYINLNILEDTRADYGKKILSTVSTKLVALYGKSFVLFFLSNV